MKYLGDKMKIKSDKPLLSKLQLRIASNIKHQNQEHFWNMVESEPNEEQKKIILRMNADAFGLGKLKEKGYRPKLG